MRRPVQRASVETNLADDETSATVKRFSPTPLRSAAGQRGALASLVERSCSATSSMISKGLFVAP